MALSVVTGLFPSLSGSISNLPGKISNFLKEKIQEQAICYVLYESNVGKLEQCVKDLEERRQSVQRHVDHESRNGKEIASKVSKWLKQVDGIIAENGNFEDDKDRPYVVCSKGFLPKPGMRYRLGRMVDRLTKEVDKLLKSSSFDDVSDGLRPMSIDFILSNINFESFKSRNAITEKIMEVLKDPTVRTIGVFGPGGVGKTTLVNEVASNAKKDKLFDVVVFANVTRNPEIKKIQGQIADQFCVRLQEESENGRASRLRDIFKKETRNILLILDDLWAGLDLNKLGIPTDDVNLSPNPAKDIFNIKMSKEEAIGDSKMLKILLTSRSREVLSSKMEVKENSIFSVEGLQDKEAEILFKKVAKVADKTPEFEPLAAKISKKCGGLPIAVVTIGNTLKYKNYLEWTDALGQLERREFTGVAESMEFSTKLSFEHLENEELKSTFLLCAQLGHYPLIMDLVKYCIGLGIFEGFLTIKETHERVLTLIEKLKDSSLLMNNYSSDRFNMHDVIRDVALSISSKEHHLFTMRNGKLSEWPHENDFKMYNAISIHNCVINEKLPNSVSCPKLKIFHVDSLDPSFVIPSGFFNEMRELRVLILTDVDLSNSTTSIRCLTNLRMLCLERCLLGDISFIGELEKLRILSLSRSKIESLPTTLGQLHKLQLLDISYCSELREIPLNVLSSLNNLEELYMRNSVKWESKGNQSENAVLAELRYLYQLKTLDVCIENAAVLPRNLFLNKLDSYKIVIGDFMTVSFGDFMMPDKDEESRVLALQIKEDNLIHSQKCIKMLFRRVENVLLGEIKGVQDLFYELNLEGFPCLKQLYMMDNSDIKYIINSKDLPDPEDVFPNLESLCLYNLMNMKKISHTKLIGNSFSKLKVVRLVNCAQLKNIFSLSMLVLLCNLEQIDVTNCASMENIVAREEHEMEEAVRMMFPKLCSLFLHTLPKFVGVNSNDQGGSAEICLFNEQVAIPNLESLMLYSINLHKIWSSQSKPFKNLIKLIVDDCDEIEFLFSFSVARSLENLKKMTVRRCKKMVKIFEYESGGNVMHEARKVQVFPKLEEIHLYRSSNLKSIWPKPNEVSQDSFPSLTYVSIRHCHKIDKVLPYHMVGRLGKLETLKVIDCDQVNAVYDLKGAKNFSGGVETCLQDLQIRELPKLEHVWNIDHEGILNFKRLHSIKVTKCRDLKYLFPLSIAIGLQELDSLLVSDCPHMEEIARNTMEEGSNKSTVPFKFPEVTNVGVVGLPELKWFYKGRHSVKWPKLKQLVVNGCDNLDVFEAKTTNSGGPIFSPKEIIPNLELMSITLKEAEWLKHRIKNYHTNHLNHFALSSCPSIETLYWLLHRMPYLERLSMLDCKFKELIPSGSLVTQPNIGIVVQLKSLNLYKLRALENIGFERDPILQWLEELYLEECHELISLAPFSVTLTHLTSLEVHQCRRLKNLMGFSTAKSLVQLISLKVTECWGLEEIVAEQNEEVQITYNCEIVFRKLITLELAILPNLSCFCSSEIYAFKFPSLEKFIVRGCPKITKFSKRVTTSPNLQVLVSEEEEVNWYWKGDLNATILKMICYSIPPYLQLSCFAVVAEIWQGKIPPLDNFFHNLRRLVVENCEFLLHVIPSHLLPYLELGSIGCSKLQVSGGNI